MVIPVVMLVVLALVVMRALMVAVAHDERAEPVGSITLEPTVPGTPAPELRARADDGVRWLLTPAVEPEIVSEHDPAADRSHSTSSER